jgi:L,D-peptidoglycan transpeptidase YkuD (ErfK/YbiS/YcfS/YnhG family)
MRQCVWLLALGAVACGEPPAAPKKGPGGTFLGGDDDQPGGDTAPHRGDRDPPPGDDNPAGGDTAVTHGDTAGPGDTAVPPGDSAPHPGDSALPPGDSAPPGQELNQTWIGGACGSASDCSSPDFTGTPLCETTGFENGMCTQSCTSTCPDTDYGPGTYNTITRCIGTPTGGRCTSECDFAQSETGCRPGYTCVLRARVNDPNRIFPICLPSNGQRWPGEAGPAFDVGQPCSVPSDCANKSCLSLPGGYCSKAMCDVAGCPIGSTCFAFETNEVTACLRDCSVDGNCREAENYLCEPETNVCWPDPAAPNWNASQGAADCTAAWSAGLHACDTTPDDYVVVRKSARNLALCNRGALVGNFNVGLGFDPIGDKEQEGDGRTPEGVFYIPRVIPQSSFYKAFLISYPDAADATRGLNAGLITTAERNAITSAQTSCTEPPQQTGLGGLVEIHGNGGGSDWTWGCVAIEDTQIDQLWSVLGTRDTIVVYP